MNIKNLIKILIGVMVTSLLLSVTVNASEDKIISSDLELTMQNIVVPIKVIILLTEKTKLKDRDSIKNVSDTILKSQEKIMEFINSQTSANDKKIRQIWLVNAIAAELTPDIIQKLAKRPDVESIIPDYPTQMADGSPTTSIER